MANHTSQKGIKGPHLFDKVAAAYHSNTGTNSKSSRKALDLKQNLHLSSRSNNNDNIMDISPFEMSARERDNVFIINNEELILEETNSDRKTSKAETRDNNNQE